jgi:hypothetical protein
MRTNLEVLKKFTKDELVMRVEKLENSNTRLTSELQEFLIETKDVKVEKLAMRLDFKTPYKWVMDNLIPNKSSDVQERWKIMRKMVELNPEWVEEVVSNGELKLSDVLHDFRGIYSEDEHFLPRIQAEDILGDFDENGDAVDFKKYQSDEWVNAQADSCLDENGDEIGKSIMDEFDVRVNGYTNIQTYRLCLVLDNEQVVPNPLKRFLELVQEDEFESNDIDIINWNEVIERYSDSILLEHSFYANK